MATKKAISAGTGRRKTATARVNLVEGKGVWTVNGVAIEEYIPSEALRDYLKQPVAISGYDMEKVDVVAFAKGGGISGQAGFPARPARSATASPVRSSRPTRRPAPLSRRPAA